MNTNHKQISAFKVRFKREEKSDWETGIALGYPSQSPQAELIIDDDFKPVNDVWSYAERHEHGCIVIDCDSK